jgi:hypothetical protein
MSSLLVFHRVYRLEIQSVMLVFRPSFVNICPSSTFSLVIWSMQNNLDNFVTEHKSMDKKLVITLRLRRSGRRERPQCYSAGQRSHRPFHSGRQSRRRDVGTACLGRRDRRGRLGRRGRRTPEFRSRRLVVRCPGTEAPV